MITSYAYPRAALIGNPSDGYYGKTIAFVFRNFSAKVEIVKSREIQIVPQYADKNTFEDRTEFEKHIQYYGYYGGLRLIKATIYKFFSYTEENDMLLQNKNFTLSYHSDIPVRLGLSGSSAIVIACLKALCLFYKIEIAKPELANLALAVETEELNISAGLQDRVAQVYERPVYMDFDKKIMDTQGYGRYETFTADLLPNLYVAYLETAAEGSEVLHNNLRQLFDHGHEGIISAMQDFARLTDEVYTCLKNRTREKIADLINMNFDLRASICPIPQKQLELITLARALKASAKFTGSGGAIIGTYDDDQHFRKLKKELASHRIKLIKPKIVDHA